ncbi:MAG: thymidine kinase [Candidatus Harrisonbacteria bacterium]|nr:thymidine kinase [Candidatus Harrisonbacteria bacterium]
MLHAIVGCMWSGKTEELYRRLLRFVLAKSNVVIFEPKANTRKVRSLHVLKTKAATAMPAPISIMHPKEILTAHKRLVSRAEVIAIDEAQFFHAEHDIAELLRVVETLAKTKAVFVAGLDTDFLHRPFGAVPHVLAVADHVTKLSAVCMQCGADATYTQRLVNGAPASADSPLILIGDTSSYEPRCRKCFRIG